MIRELGERAELGPAMTLPGATELLAAGSAALSRSVRIFDLSAVAEVDSSALAVLFGWVREARRLNKPIQVVNPPKELLSLAEVYGVSDLLPLA